MEPPSAAVHWPVPWRLRVIDALDREKMLDHIQAVGGYFKKKLQGLAAKHDSVEDVRGMGLMLAIELKSAELAKAGGGQDAGAAHPHQPHQ